MFADSIFLTLLIFGIIMSIQDIKQRKVKNSITYSFIAIAIIIYIISKFMFGTSLSIIITLLGSMFMSFLLFHKNIIGAADAKISIGITLLLLSFNNEIYVFDFILNIIILYTITIIILSIFKTSIKSKLKILTSTPYYIIIFQTLFTLTIFSLFLRFVGFENIDPLLALSILILLLFILAPIAKKLYQKCDENSQIVISFTLFAYTFYELFNFFITSFITLYLIKTIIYQITYLSENIIYKNNKGFALVPILILASLFVLILEKNLILYFFVS